MALTKISGLVSNFQQETVITSSQHGRTGAGIIHSDKVINFRVDNKPVALKLKENVDLTNGEQVTVVGKHKKGAFKGLALRNESTGVIYATKTWPALLGGIAFILLGIPLVSVIIGLVIVPLGVLFLYGAWLNVRSIALLKAS